MWESIMLELGEVYLHWFLSLDSNIEFKKCPKYHNFNQTGPNYHMGYIFATCVHEVKGGFMHEGSSIFIFGK